MSDPKDLLHDDPTDPPPTFTDAAATPRYVDVSITGDRIVRTAAADDLETVLADPFDELPLRDAPVVTETAAFDVLDVAVTETALALVPRPEPLPVDPWAGRWA